MNRASRYNLLPIMPSVAEEYGRGMCEECVRGEVHSVATNAPVAQECMTNVKGM